MSEGIEALKRRIDEQAAVVRALTPNSQRHQIATTILLLMRDSLAVQLDIAALEGQAWRSTKC